MNVRQCDMCLNSKSLKKASNITIYRYKIGWQEQKILKGYFIPNKIR